MTLVRKFRIFLFFFVFSTTSQAQIFKSNGIFDKINKIAPGADNASWKPGAAITTSIKDSLPGVRLLRDSDFDPTEADSVQSFLLKPGYYRTTIRSYCLHAGTYGATKGSGYQIAVLKGNCATLVSQILDRSAAHPEIVQRDVQLLIWGIESGNRFTDYPSDFQLRVKPLLTEKDIALMQVKISHITEKLVPGPLKDMADTYQSLRNKMNKAQMNYDDIEKVAVKAGVPPTGLGSLEIKEGLWSYIGNGFYIRVYPRNYTTTDLEIYRPGNFTLKKDGKDRIVSFARGTEQVTIEYDDGPGADLLVSKGHPSIPIWRFKRCVYTNGELGISEEIKNKGWVLRGPVTGIMGDFAVALPYQTRENISWDEVVARYKEAKSRYDEVKDGIELAKKINDADKIQNYDEYLNEKAVQEQIYAGLKAASNPASLKGKSNWIHHLLKMDRDLMYWIDCQLAGSCNNSNDPATPDLPTKVGQPGNSGAQRLGLSPFIKN